MYTDKVMRHFKKPKNVGQMKDADAIAKVGNPNCGDIMYVYIKVAKNKQGEEIISDNKSCRRSLTL